MPISKHHDMTRDLTIFTAAGELTFEAQKAVLEAFYNGETTANVLWDMRLITGNRISCEEIREIITLIKQHRDKRARGKTALVTQTDLDFGLSRMSDAYAEIENIPWEIASFRSMQEALDWMFEQHEDFSPPRGDPNRMAIGVLNAPRRK